ncbi:hypothetical protein D9M71_508460 [compost metagenome]
MRQPFFVTVLGYDDQGIDGLTLEFWVVGEQGVGGLDAQVGGFLLIALARKKRRADLAEDEFLVLFEFGALGVIIKAGRRHVTRYAFYANHSGFPNNRQLTITARVNRGAPKKPGFSIAWHRRRRMMPRHCGNNRGAGASIIQLHNTGKMRVLTYWSHSFAVCHACLRGANVAGSPGAPRRRRGFTPPSGPFGASDLVEQAELGDFGESQLRGLEHGLLQCQSDGRGRHISIADS